MAVPITNSLTFLFTLLMGHMLGEKIGGWKTILGMVMIVTGVALCVFSKLDTRSV